MDLHDKKAWLQKNGQIIHYDRVAGFEPTVRWIANNRGRNIKHVSAVMGKDYKAIGRLYNAVKDDLYEMCNESS